MEHATTGSNLADLLERVLDKGVVISGDIKVKLVDIELLTIQVRLLICSVDKAKELGMDWWRKNPGFSQSEFESLRSTVSSIDMRMAEMESKQKGG